MPAAPDDLFAYLDRLGISHRSVSHSPLFTVEQSRALRGTIPGGHSKNLFLRDKKGALFLLSALEQTTIPLKSLHRALGATGRLSFATAEAMQTMLGVEPGSVTPFAVLNDTTHQVRVALDAGLLNEPLINFHPLVNTMTTGLAPRDLLRFLNETGHPPAILAFPQDDGDTIRPIAIGPDNPI